MTRLPATPAMLMTFTLLAACGGGRGVALDASDGRLDATDATEAADVAAADAPDLADPSPDLAVDAPGDPAGVDDFEVAGQDTEAGEDGFGDTAEAGEDATVPDESVDAGGDEGAEPGPDATGDDGAGDAGSLDPGAGDEGLTDPGIVDPGLPDLDPTDPGALDPGPVDPGPQDTGPDVVYTGIYAGMETLTGAALATALCPLVRTGFTTISYSDAGDALRQSIDTVNGQVKEIYTGVLVNKGNGLNVEHSWPQSKFGSGEATAKKSDLFHLYASNATYNSSRGNLPYGVVVTKDWPDPGDDVGNPNCTDHFPGHPAGCFSIRGTDAAGAEVFEPRDAHKGNAARAILYFSLRYGTNCKPLSLSVFDGYEGGHAVVTEATLKEWNRLDPPDAVEQARNDRIQAVQHVRNPFIDHPEFADRISFQ